MRKIGKTYLKSFHIIATSTNFSDMSYSDGNEFDVGDSETAISKMYSNMRADSGLLQLLNGLDDRDKIILLYQVLREAGYNLNHTDCANTLRITREHYMKLLRELKERAGKTMISSLNN